MHSACVLCMICATKTDQLLAEAPVDIVDEFEAGIDEFDILSP